MSGIEDAFAVAVVDPGWLLQSVRGNDFMARVEETNKNSSLALMVMRLTLHELY